ncbi:MAG: ribosome recycling factor [Candidatus Nomurabacteria bacterium]|jgi:ribosome recycling factor|nr:ribosome recycling factor [Candidatus Nomurabacteria bacterium]
MFDTTPYENRFEAAVGHFEEELKKVRTGRAHPDMLDGVMVMAYGAQMPLRQVASVTAPEADQILVTPFDPANIQDIALAIRNDLALGFNPSDDGRNVRVPIPPLTEETRREIVKNLGDKAENTRVQLRNVREEARKAIKVLTSVSDDEKKRLEKGIDDSVAKFNARIDEIFKAKEAEIMKI